MYIKPFHILALGIMILKNVILSFNSSVTEELRHFFFSFDILCPSCSTKEKFSPIQRTRMQLAQF